MIKITSKEKLPIIAGEHFEGHITAEEPYKFVAKGFDQNLTKAEWEKLKAFTGESKDDGDSELEELKKQYESMDKKNSKDGVALRARIKELEAVAKA